MGAWAALGRPARSLAAKCQTNLGGPPSVRSATFPGGETERQRSVASGKWPCSRLLPMSWPGEASRPIAVSSATCGASRLLRCLGRAKPRDHWCLAFRARTSCSDCLASLRPSERRSVSQAWSRCCSGGMQGWSDWSGAGAKLASQSSCAGGTVPILGSASVGSVKPGCCLFLTRSEATRFQCLTPRLKSSANLNGWNARMTFKYMKPLYARAV
jgi:hypothetical protein